MNIQDNDKLREFLDQHSEVRRLMAEETKPCAATEIQAEERQKIREKVALKEYMEYTVKEREEGLRGYTTSQLKAELRRRKRR